MAGAQKLYVSFHPDDNKGGKERSGWVDEFTRVLAIFLHRLNGESPEIILLDLKDKAPASLGEGDGLAIVVSENYLSAKLFQRDLPLLVNRDKIFKIDLSPLGKRQLPVELRILNEFHFYGPTGEKGESFRRLDGSSDGQKFWLKIVDFSLDVLRVLYKKTFAIQREDKSAIFLAEASYDQVANRDEIKRELIRHGYDVLPKTPFSSDLATFEKEVTDCLQKADLTIQIIGEQYGEVPDGGEKSIVEIQNDLATKYYSKTLSESEHALHRLIWMPLNLRPSSDQQKLYLDRLRDDISSTAGAEIIQTPLEILKTIIHARLEFFRQEKAIRAKTIREKSDKKFVYVLFDQKDASEVNDLISAIKTKGIEVILPDFSTRQLELLRQHRENLLKSDAVLLFANNNLNWLNSKLNDVIKAPGFGKSYPFDAKAVIIKDSSIPKDKITNHGDLMMLNGVDKDKKNPDLGPFIDKLAKR